jgi:hypothetical protein
MLSDRAPLDSALASFRARIALALPQQIRECLDVLEDSQLWWRPNEHTNAIGNILLHLTGSLNEYLNRNLGGIDYQRDRSAEWSRRDVPKTELVALFDDMVAKAKITFDTLDATRLGEPSPVAALHHLVIDDLINIATHLGNHTGQIVWITKMLRERALDELWIRTHQQHVWR